MKAEIFKVGDKVYHYKYGWGEITRIEGNAVIKVNFFAGAIAFIDGNLLSFTEYTLQGFSQERPIELPKVGELCLVKDFKDSVWKAREFKKFTTHFLDTSGERWDEFKRIKILD